MNRTVQFSNKTIRVQNLLDMYEKGRLNLEPGFQRKSVWKPKDRNALIDSVLKNYPLPAIFLYERTEGGDTKFDVIDGKQRIETFLMFTGRMRGKFIAESEFRGDEKVEVSWAALKKSEEQYRITNYEFPSIELSGDLSDIVDVFVRINSTGKSLTGQEKRNAKYYLSPFLKEANKIARKFEDRFKTSGVFSDAQQSRMKHVEFVSELMLSIHKGEVINKKASLDAVMEARRFPSRQLSDFATVTKWTLNWVFRNFSGLSETRFRKVADFYSLCVLISKLHADGYVLANSKRNQIAWNLLKAFAANVDAVADAQKSARSGSVEQGMYRDYLLTVLQGTDEKSQRQKREDILRAIVENLFAKKDAQRIFSPEQRRILWNTSAEKVCAVCGEKLTWSNFTVDHVVPHSKGGRTVLGNADLLCRAHNSSKGNKTKRRSKR